jgi:hypothetical protein
VLPEHPLEGGERRLSHLTPAITLLPGPGLIAQTQVLSPLDLLTLTATVDNRREIMKLQRALKEDG